jgi:hypothetical protein
MSFVFQDVVLFNDTVINNIRIGKKDAGDEEVYAAAKMARCDEFIRAMPEGYNTLIGENGSTLSGGERQLDETCNNLVVNRTRPVDAALAPKAILFVHYRPLAVAAQQMNVPRPENFERAQQQDDFKRVLAPIDIVTEEQIRSRWRT